ncbi:MAG: GLUG motif-containing protein [Balneolales bacterium]
MKYIKYTIALLILFISVSTVQAQFDGGDGTEGDPYQVATLQQLQDVGTAQDQHYILTADIDATDTETWNDGAGFEPYSDFTGSFDGNDFVISNLTIDREEEDNVGLFGVNSGTITNVTIEDATITGNEQVGALVGENSGIISNSSSSGEVSGLEIIGGLVGINEAESELNNSYSSASVTAQQTVAGGLAGKNDGTISESHSSSSVTSGEIPTDGFGTIGTGGLVGVNSSGLITASFATGEVNMPGTDFRAGGLVGYNNGGEIINSYATGNVTGDERVGGLVGGNRNGGSIRGSYASGLVTAEDDMGGLTGNNTEVIEDSYWDTEATGQSEADGNEEPGTAVGLTTDQMTGTSAYEGMEVFDFDETWQLTVNYPALYWEDVDALEPVFSYGGGDGTEGDPFQIATLIHLQDIKENLDAHFVQTSFIYAPDSENWNDGAGFEPIGTPENPFTGSFDGNGWLIDNLYINREDETNVGLFGVVSGSLSNIVLFEAHVAGGDTTGALAGYSNGEITNSQSTGDVTGNANVGGLVGINSGGQISTSSSKSTVVGHDWKTGGLVGTNEEEGVIDLSYANGSVENTVGADGMPYNIGGLVGRNIRATISNSYASGEIIAEISGSWWDPKAGGLVGDHRSEDKDAEWSSILINSYYDSTAANVPLANGAGPDGPDWNPADNQDGVVALSTEQITGAAAYDNMEGFDFNETWGLTEGYPAHRWESVNFIDPDWFAAGVGTEEDPYQIETLAQLQDIENKLNSHFILTRYIYAPDTENWNDGAGFDPIGNDENPFSGSFDGNGWIIDGLYINRENESRVGLFSEVTGSIINVILENVDITGGEETGALAGRNSGEITNSNTSGTGVVTSAERRVGGLIGDNRGNITDSYSQSSVTGAAETGGLSGFNGGAIRSSFAKGDVAGTGRVGGLVGYNTNGGEIHNSYTNNSVVGSEERVGGLVGDNRNDGTISSSYAASTVEGDSQVGGFAGYNQMLISDSYFDSEIADMSSSVGNGDVFGVTALTTAEMKGEASFENMAFDFEEMWTPNEGYPALAWEDVDPIEVSSELRAELPTEVALDQNYPNPFNPTTNIRYAIPAEAHVRLNVYNVLGQDVATLVNKSMAAGSYETTFDASRLASGTYIYRLEAGDKVLTQTMMLIK